MELYGSVRRGVGAISSWLVGCVWRGVPVVYQEKTGLQEATVKISVNVSRKPFRLSCELFRLGWLLDATGMLGCLVMPGSVCGTQLACVGKNTF